ncbi:hypothetical protein TNCV_3248231 [Trichonephila clavipes]|nr:hypothetical protein TNCV_3248231 [Trichonephila clavipes]
MDSYCFVACGDSREFPVASSVSGRLEWSRVLISRKTRHRKCLTDYQPAEAQSIHVGFFWKIQDWGSVVVLITVDLSSILSSPPPIKPSCNFEARC